MAKFVRVEIPIRKPDPTITLCNSISAKHTAMGAGSPLTGIIDMADFAVKLGDAISKRSSAALKEGTAQKKFQLVETQSGLAKEQRKDHPATVLWYVRQVRDLLLVMNNGTEEELSEYGFNVVITVVTGRKHVKIELPAKPAGLLTLAQAIIAHHTLLGAGSPLTAALVDMTAFETLVNDTATLLGEWTALRAEIQSLNNQALNIMGYDVGQTASNPDTLYNYLINIRARLLQKYFSTEEELSEWGFKVLRTYGFSGRKKSSDAGLSIKGKVTDSATGEPLSNALVYNTETDTFTTTDDEGAYSIPTLPAGVYNLQAHKTNYQNSGTVQVTIVSGQLSTVNFQLNAESGSGTGTITGTVTNNGQPYQALLTVTAGNTTVTTHTLASGAFNLAGVPSGVQTIICTPDDNPANLKNQQVTVPDGNSVTADFVYP